MESNIDKYYRFVSQSPFTIEELMIDRRLSAEIVASFFAFRNIFNSSLKKVIDRWKIFDSGENGTDINAIYNKFIRTELGGLEDLPQEFSIFIQNSIWEYFSILTEADKPGWVTKQIRLNVPVLKSSIDSVVWRRAHLEGIIVSLPETLRAIRDIDTPKMRQYSIDYYLDVWKYEIKNVENKPAFLRSLERAIIKRKHEF